MRTVKLILLSAALLSAADPIPANRQEEISRAALAVQAAQIRLQQLQLAEKEAEREVEQTSARYDALVTRLQTEFHAAGCKLDPFSKEWVCPKPDKQDQK